MKIKAKMRARPEWVEGRWHLEGRGIHAGDMLQIRWPDGTWETVRIESSRGGLMLFAHGLHHGQTFSVQVDDTVHQLRWSAP